MVLASRFRGSMLRLPLSGMVYCEIATRTLDMQALPGDHRSTRNVAELTAIEVLEVEDDLAAISDNEVKEGSKTSLAARKVLRSIGELPKSLVDDLRSVLNARQEVGKGSLSARRKERGIQPLGEYVTRIYLPWVQSNTT